MGAQVSALCFSHSACALSLHGQQVQISEAFSWHRTDSLELDYKLSNVCTFPSSFPLTRNTVPKEPLPITFSITKSSRLAFLATGAVAAEFPRALPKLRNQRGRKRRYLTPTLLPLLWRAVTVTEVVGEEGEGGT